jgi:hypothetical protein
MNKKECTLCGDDVPAGDVLHLPLYVIGSEGIEACLTCRMALTEVARAIRHTAGKARKNGYLLARHHAAIK